MSQKQYKWINNLQRWIIGLAVIMLPVCITAQITVVSIVPTNRTVNQQTVHTFTFTSSQTIPVNGRIAIAYNSGYDISGVVNASSTTMDGIFTITTGASTVYLTRSGGTAQAPGIEDIQISFIRNPITSATYNYNISTRLSDNTIIESGSCSDFIYAGVLHHFSFTGVPAGATAGSGFAGNISVIARDEFNNRKSNYLGSVTWSHSDPNPATVVPVDDGTGWSSGEKFFNGSDFILYTTGSRTLTVQDGAISSATTGISVGPGPVVNFTLSCAASQTAGTPFTLSVGGAVDAYGNAWSGTVNIALSSGGGNSPNGTPPTIPSQITVTIGTGSNTNVILTNKVVTQFQGTAGSVVRYSSPITVNAAALNGFSLSATTPVTVGIGFPVQVNSADDNYGNGWTGFIQIDASQGGGIAPDGTPPTFNPISVNNGSGSALQTLSRTQNTVLRGQSGGVTATTALLIVNPGNIQSFMMSGTPVSSVAGSNFSQGVLVTAYDPFGNIKTNYNGFTYFTSTDPQALLAYDLANPFQFSSGSTTFPGSAFQLRTAGSQTITIVDAAPNPDVSYTSPVISVQAAAITQFTMTCGLTQIAGQAFPVSITDARDAYNNPWSGAVTISAASGGSNSPNGATPSFNPIFVIGGSGQANQMFVCAEIGINLQAQAGSITQTRSNIVVTYGNLVSLKIRDAGGGMGNEVVTRSMSVGQGLTLFAAGYDLYGNYRQEEPSNWSSSAGLFPAVTHQNIGYITFAPTTPGTGTISASAVSNPIISDYTGTIMVQSGALHHFKMAQSNNNEILTKIKDFPFTIRITAQDAVDNTVSSFNGSVQLSDLTGTVEPQTLGPFENGQWVGNITISRIYENDRLTVQTTTGEIGQSNLFNIILAPGSLVNQFQALQADTTTPLVSITTGQQRDWFVKMGIENVGSVALRLDSVRIEMKVNGVIQNDYTIVYPNQFLGNHSDLLPGGVIDSLLIRIDETGQSSGAMTLEGSLYLKNTEDGKTLSPDDAYTSLTVQTPANVTIQTIRTSRLEVTRAQQVAWQVSMIIRNTGESEIRVDPNISRTGISFNIGSDWQIGWPENMAGGDWILGGKETDSLLYNISQTASNTIGNCQVQGFIFTQEMNTLRNITRNSIAAKPVYIEEQPSLRILSVTNFAENAPRVNTNQNFTFGVTLENSGGDAIQNINLEFISNGSFLPSSYFVGVLRGNEQKTVTIEATAGTVPTNSEVIWVNGSGIAENTAFPLFSEDPVDDSTKVIIQNPAMLEILSVIPTEIELLGGRVDEWRVKVVVRNPMSDPLEEQGNAVLQVPATANLVFIIDQTAQEDYTVIPFTELARGGLTLSSGITDTLIYRITATGRRGGTVSINARITGEDQNLTSRNLTASKTAMVTVTPERMLRIFSTKIQTPHMISDVAYANTQQQFNLSVTVENGLGQSVKNIQIHLTTDGQSVIADSANRWIPLLNPSKSATVQYTITSTMQADLTGETFTAILSSARFQLSSLPVSPGPAIDSTAIIVIQSPAELSLDLTSERPADHTYSTNQVFSVLASVNNLGHSSIDNSCILRIYLPNRYQLISQSDTVHIGSDLSAIWKIRSPSTPESSLPISVDWYQKPKDINTNEEVIIAGSEVSETIYVKTIASRLNTDLIVYSPTGAQDVTISTDQIVTVIGVVQWNNVRNIITTLELPDGFTTTSNREQSVNWESAAKLDTINWLVQAPAEASSNDSIRVTTRGYDAIQTTIPVLEYNMDPIVVTTVNKAALALFMSITEPADALDGSLSPGQSFTIHASVTNHGSADTTGTTIVSINPLPSGYSTPDGILEKFLINGEITWEIVAPMISSAKAGKIEGKIIRAPLDENTNQAAYIIPNSSSFSIPVTTESYLLAVTQETMSPWVDASLVPGQSKVKLMILSFDNRGIRGGNHIIIDNMKFVVEDRFGEPISPSAVLSRVYVVNDEDSLEVYGSTIDIQSENPVTVTLSRLLSIPVDGNPALAIFTDISDPVSAQYFQINLVDGSYVSAKDAESRYPVPVKNTAEEDWVDMRSAPKYIYNPEVESNLWCSPNPFGQSEKPYTTVRYFLKKNSNVHFYLYTLVGQLVWSYEIPMNDQRAAAGPHTFTWDGKNDNNRSVLNGVYIMYMKTDDGIEGKFKIAVVK